MPSLPANHRPAPRRAPYENSRTAAKRITGRALQARNARIKLRDGYTCQCGCKRLCLPHELEVDHKLPLAAGGTEDDSNLQSLYVGCHEVKSLKERGCEPVQGCDVDGYPVGGQW